MPPSVRLTLYATVASLGLVLLARRWLVIVTVRGRSMAPALRPGDRVLVLRRRRGAVRRGGVVVVERPGSDRGWGVPAPAGSGASGRHWWIKRVAAVAGDPVPAGVLADGSERVPRGHVVVLGEGTGSGDSRRFGFVPLDRVLGSVLLRLAPSAPADAPVGPRPDRRG